MLQQVGGLLHLSLYNGTNVTIIQGVLDIVRRHALRVIYRYAHIHEKGVPFHFLYFQYTVIGVALDVAKTDDHKFIPNGG